MYNIAGPDDSSDVDELEVLEVAEDSSALPF